MASSSIAAGQFAYPEGCLEAMQQHFKTYSLNAADIAMSLGNPKCMNVVLFGAMTKALAMDHIDWEAVTVRRCRKNSSTSTSRRSMRATTQPNKPTPRAKEDPHYVEPNHVSAGRRPFRHPGAI